MVRSASVCGSRRLLASTSASPAAFDCFTSTLARTSGLLWDDILQCSTEPASVAKMQALGAAATPAHDYVPWLLVDGVQLGNPDALMALMCASYKGVLPPPCASPAGNTGPMMKGLHSPSPRRIAEREMANF